VDALEEADAAYEAAEAAYLTALRSQADRGVLAKVAASVAAAAGAWNTLAYAAFHAAANQPHQPNLDRLTERTEVLSETWADIATAYQE
jgi:formylmethanofuran:tetrahydromethanopterin formyltransferase